MSKLAFSGHRHIRNWLLNHKRGREVLDECIAQRCEACTRPRRHRALVILHSDGWVEVYGRRRFLQVTVANKLHTEEETLAEEYLDMTLPKGVRQLYAPIRLLAAGQVDRMTAREELERRWRVEWLAALREVGSCRKKKTSR